MAEDAAITQISELINGEPETQETEDEKEVPEQEQDEPDSVETEEEQAEVEDDSAEVESITQLAKELEVEPETVYSLRVDMGSDLEPKTISELKDYYQEQEHAKTTFETKEKEYQQQQQRLETELRNLRENTQTAQQPQQIVSEEINNAMAEVQRIENSFNSIDWERFEQEDPGNAALQRQKLSDAYHRARNIVEQEKAKVEQQEIEKENKQREYQSQKMRELVPEWNDSNVAKNEAHELLNFMTEYGFGEEETKNIGDARVIRVLLDFMKQKKEISKAKPAEKFVDKKRPTIKSGSLRLGGKGNKEKTRLAIMKRGKAAIRGEDKAAAISDLLDLENGT